MGIDHLAQAAGVSYNRAVNDLRYMVRARLLLNVYVDQGNRQVITQRVQEPWDDEPIPSNPQNGQGDDPPLPPVPGGQQGAPADPAPRLPVAVHCAGCGAVSTILPDEIKYCEFCGNILPRSG
ncbi:hypothetical protein GCM10010911_55960 [Paenibacillus nasutitermitis]|uniref:Uncharacterized protein n=2 Tax=Paenibacillus nasutitermitis TaxID=1652958 RepID=A0A916ZEH6_9BACL|nr:hypothetical protein GCM10010911_55960 [Paenibacillus nasutitermitis]